MSRHSPDRDSRDEVPVASREDEIAAPTAGEPASGAPDASDPVRSAFDRGVVWCARGAAWLVF
ncbi:hypothetical protein ACW4DH_18940, partial [Halomonas sp. WWR20]